MQQASVSTRRLQNVVPLSWLAGQNTQQNANTHQRRILFGTLAEKCQIRSQNLIILANFDFLILIIKHPLNDPSKSKRPNKQK